MRTAHGSHYLRHLHVLQCKYVAYRSHNFKHGSHRASKAYVPCDNLIICIRKRLACDLRRDAHLTVRQIICLEQIDS